jgi:hypothetical protein
MASCLSKPHLASTTIIILNAGSSNLQYQSKYLTASFSFYAVCKTSLVLMTPNMDVSSFVSYSTAHGRRSTSQFLNRTPLTKWQDPGLCYGSLLFIFCHFFSLSLTKYYSMLATGASCWLSFVERIKVYTMFFVHFYSFALRSWNQTKLQK